MTSAKPEVLVIWAGSIRTDAAGMGTLAKLNADLAVYRQATIHLDFQHVRWMDAHLASLLMIIVRHSQAKANSITFINMAADVKTILGKNGFLKQKAVDQYHTTMPTTEFQHHEGIAFSGYTRRHLLRPEMPKMTDALKGKFYEGLDELFANSSLHSKSARHTCVCGQFYPKNGKLAFSIADGGIGIDGALLAGKNVSMIPSDAIDWAMQPGSTTRSGDVPGGLGLKLIRSFVALNGGRLTVVSSAGFWCQTGGDVYKAELKQPFPGTGVVFEIATADQKHYDLVAAPDPRNIW